MLKKIHLFIRAGLDMERDRVLAEVIDLDSANGIMVVAEEDDRHSIEPVDDVSDLVAVAEKDLPLPLVWLRMQPRYVFNCYK